MIEKQKLSNVKLHSHQTADQPPSSAVQFLWHGRVKNYPLWMKSVSIPDQYQLYPRCIPDAPTLKSRSSRPTPSFWLTNPRSARPTPDLFLMQLRSLRSISDQPPICMLDFHSQSQMNNSSKCHANRLYYEGSVLEMRIWPLLLILKWWIHLSRSLFLYLLYNKDSIYVTYRRKKINKHIGVQCKRRLTFLKVVDVIQDF